jgi:hypothetical protein
MIVPYVFPGRFIEALETGCHQDKEEWKSKKVIFSHQEFRGCKMGAIVSLEGDEWNSEYPQVISGHIHDNQKVGTNIYYPGTPLQHAFGDSDIRVVCSVEIGEDIKDDIKDITITDHHLNVPKKHIIKSSIKDIEKINEKMSKIEKNNKNNKIKVKIEGTQEEFKLFKETKEYKDMISNGVKIQLQKQKSDILEISKDKESVGDFRDILEKMINNDEHLVKKIYDEIKSK